MRATLAAAVIALIVAIGWGLLAASEPAPPRAQDITVPAPPGWEASLPRDPQSAAQAFIVRVPAEVRARGEAIGQTRYWILAGRILLSVGAILLFLFSGAAAALARALKRATRSLLLQSLIFAAALFVLLFAATLPAEVYAAYVRPRSFGFADRPFLDWLQDHTLTWGATTAFYVVGLTVFGWLLRRRPTSWVAYAGLLYFVLASAFVLALPVFIEPLSNTFTPLPDSPIKREMLALAHGNGVPAADIYMGDASRQSRLRNAHVSGFGDTARISIDDTALAAGEDNVLWLVAHEIGHYVMGHMFNSVFVISAVAVLGFAFIAWLGPLAIRVFGGYWGVADFASTAGLAVFWLLFVVWGFVSEPITNTYIRWQEAQADLFGLNASGRPLGMADFMIHGADTQPLYPSDVDIYLFYDHAPYRARIEAAMRWRADHMPPGQPLAEGRLTGM